MHKKGAKTYCRQNNKIAALRLVFIYEELHIVDISTVINYYSCDPDLEAL
jgi:hypothetical protein